jgi:hypothetical protein
MVQDDTNTDDYVDVVSFLVWQTSHPNSIALRKEHTRLNASLFHAYPQALLDRVDVVRLGICRITTRNHDELVTTAIRDAVQACNVAITFFSDAHQFIESMRDVPRLQSTDNILRPMPPHALLSDLN